MSGVWCRGLVGLMLVAVGAAIEMYYELPARNAAEDLDYQNYNDVYTLPLSVEQKLSPKAADQDVMMYKILRMLQMDSPEYYSNRIPEIRDSRNQVTDFSGGMVMKRLSGFVSRPERFRFRPQFRSADDSQKTKKEGKPIGSNQICYFKLCSFAPPSK
ncbi:unnamed protein product [Chilo suppressalis]|uniref:Uncharacterized protein n=1 Tax=Chilo suppressalis TaxID=168631 RepID=A0ABN8EBA6_CHISP|nr:unnamed protein product [Chilo suppressalis]